MRVIVYGLGNNFTRCIGWIKANYEVVGLVDGAQDKQGTIIDGLTVCDIDNIVNVDYDVVIVTPNESYEITQRLIEKGVSRETILHLPELMNRSNGDGKLKIYVELIGGLGDQLIGLNYIYCLKRFVGDKIADVILVTDEKRRIASDITESLDFIDDYIVLEDKSEIEKNSDLYIKVIRYPQIIYSNKKRIALIKPELVDYIFSCERFEVFNPRHFERGIIPDGGSGLYEELFSKKRIQQPDIDGILGIKDHFEFRLDVDEKCMDRLKLRKDGFITVHRGCDPNYFSNTATKMWPLDYYNELLAYIKKQYPDLKLVAIGAAHEKSAGPLDVDLDYVGETSVEEWMALLKYSKLHIDSEGGNVHLREVLNGGTSIVIFGPTSDKFFGYKNNINIRTSACPYPCEWATLDWSKKCLCGDNTPRCMKSVLPEEVFEKLKQELGDE